MKEKWYNLTHQGAFTSIATEFQWKIREFSHNPWMQYEVALRQIVALSLLIVNSKNAKGKKDMKKIYSWSLLPAPILILIVSRT